jgi:L-lactate dehydrogenase complex protein LldF
MEITSNDFKANARQALDDPQLQRALNHVRQNFIGKRQKAVDKLPEFEQLRADAKAIKDHTLIHLDLYLEAYEERVTAQGGHVHYAETADDARRIILDICRRTGAKTVTKGKSMVSEEIALNDHLAENGIQPIETDLGEYIIQLRGEMPSHIIAPAVHVNKDQVEADFRRFHTHLPVDRDLSEPSTLLAEARGILRDRFLAADVGVTGANFLVAETGTSIIVTNEGNGDLTQILPRVHVVIATIEKLVPTLNDVATIFRLLARSATGQDMSVYTTLSTGPRRAEDPDGPEEYHVVILDNGRTAMLGTEFQDTHELPNASTFCGRCESVCPMMIPLPGMMRHWREKEFERALSPATQRYGIRFWAFFAKRPALYRLVTRIAMRALGNLGGSEGRLHWLPLAGGWTKHRDMPAPAGRTFMDLYKSGSRGA